MTAILTAGLSKEYGGPMLPGRRHGTAVRALDDLSIEVREGEIFGFLGPNGAGKSTTIRLLLGFLHPTAGSASVFGLDVTSHGLDIRRRTGYLPGGIALYDSMTGEQVLEHLVRLYGRPPVRRARLVERLELSERTLRRPVRDYSRGMRQKIGIIQALQHDPEIAILDEPTEGLDPLMQRAFYEVLADLRTAGRTIFFSSHVLSEVERVCDRVAIVRRGELVAVEDVGRLLERRRRNVQLRFFGPPPSLDGLPGAQDVRVRDGVVTLQLDGAVSGFLAAIAGTDVQDLTIEPARLEEAFLEFYSSEASVESPDPMVAPSPAS